MRSESKNNFFIYIWTVFLVLLPAYSVYVLINSSTLAKINNPTTDQIIPLVGFKIILGIYFFISIINIKKLFDKKIWLPVIIFVGLFSRIILIPSSPVLEDDYYRYLWDGAVTANGFNPFEYSPLEIENNESQVPEKLIELKNESRDIFKKINHRHIRTIYPVLSQLSFAAAYLLSPWHVWVWKMILLAFDLTLLFTLYLLLKQLKLPIIFLSFYWLNPIVLHEFYAAAHMDLLALPFVIASLYFFIKSKQHAAIIFLALATGFKVWPLVLLPLYLVYSWNDKKLIVKNILIYTGLVLLLFVPVLLSGINDSLGFVRYAEAWVNNAAVYNIISGMIKWLVNITGFSFSYSYLLPRFAIGLIYLVLMYFILRKKAGTDYTLIEKALLFVSILFLIGPAQFPWYYTWMVPLLVIRPKASLLFYPVLLPLYNLNYLSEYLVYIQHLPVIIFFIWELKTKKTEKYFKDVGTNSSVLQ
jgi:alpha-1,6-mannosyltransferase